MQLAESRFETYLHKVYTNGIGDAWLALPETVNAIELLSCLFDTTFC